MRAHENPRRIELQKNGISMTWGKTSKVTNLMNFFWGCVAEGLFRCSLAGSLAEIFGFDKSV